MKYFRIACGDGVGKSGPGTEGNRLKSSPHATPMVRVQRGKVPTTDGPFAETKEQLGVPQPSDKPLPCRCGKCQAVKGASEKPTSCRATSDATRALGTSGRANGPGSSHR
jgi:hypothetical protein